jgi:hypothetical protein
MTDFSQPPQQRDFHCRFCNGRIVIPYDLQPTTGPCPHCQATITSPPPPQAPAQSFAPQPMAAPPQPAVRPAVIPPRRVEVEAPAPQPAPAEQPAVKPKKRSSGIIPAMVALFFMILAGGAAVYYLSSQMGKNVEPPNYGRTPEDNEIREANYIRIGWQADAYKTLDAFIAGSSVDGKLPHIINAEALRDKMDMFYGGVVINDSDTPANSFAVQELTEEDKKRGIFMLTYDQPPQFAIKDFFRPLAPLEVQYGIEEADILLGTMARMSNFAMDPVRVHAFFKRTDQGLKLDWEVFAQTKYRTFRNFTELPDVGAVETFRVLIVEDVPDKGQGVAGTRTYRMVDPANIEDSTRVNVKLDSATGKELSVINWRGTKQGVPMTRTATVELEWTGEPDNPVLTMKRLVCWEFLGLGGVEIPATASTQ